MPDEAFRGRVLTEAVVDARGVAHARSHVNLQVGWCTGCANGTSYLNCPERIAYTYGESAVAGRSLSRSTTPGGTVTDIVPAEDIERIVGVERHKSRHYARAVSAEQRVYILHSQDCLAMHPDLRECPWSLALDEGIDLDEWTEDAPTWVNVRAGRLVPLWLGA